MKRYLHSQQQAARVLNVVLDLDQKGDSLLAVKQTVVVGQSNNHDRADLDLSVDSDGLLLNGVKTEDSSLGEVDDGGTEEGTVIMKLETSKSRESHNHSPEDTTVRDGKSAASHILNGELAVAGLFAELGNRALDLNHVHTFSVADNRGYKTLGGSDGDGNIDIVTVDDGVTTVGTLNGCVDSRNILHSLDNGFREGAHETQLDASLLHDGLLVELTHLHEVGHVDLVKGGEGGGGVLRLLQALSNTEAHAVHFDL